MHDLYHHRRRPHRPRTDAGIREKLGKTALEGAELKWLEGSPANAADQLRFVSGCDKFFSVP
jgi:hypothetical protein